jgi:1-acyl-sn-glycerol-3-phosphate acyltransferase
VLTFFARAFLGPLARMIWRPTIIGRSNMPASGPVVVASNHLSFIDSIIISLLARRPVSFLAKEEYFTGTGLKGAVSRGFFSGVGAVPVTRGAGQAAQDALDAGLAKVQAGQAFSIYPEGTRSRDGRLYRGKTGVAWLALTAGAPVIPVALTGTQNLQPVGSKRIRLARITIEFGEPMDISAFGLATSGRARRLATDAIMARIQSMSHQEYVDRYNEPPPVSVRERVRRFFRTRAEL